MVKDRSNRNVASHGCGDGHRTKVDPRRPIGRALGRRAENGRTCTVDLSAVTFIDKGGQRLLRIMAREATQFIATSIYIKRVLDQWEPSGKRRLRKIIHCFFGALLGGVVAPLSLMQASRKSTLLAPSATHTPAVVGTRANPLGGKERQTC